MENSNVTTRQKALALNLDATTYGTFAEIGGGQEVARWFFSVGGAAGTVAKTISAYDMAVSDALYGAARQYVSRQRLEAMLEHEFGQLIERLDGARGDSKSFFAFADTVATRKYGKPDNGRGWLGIRFQHHPHEKPSTVIIHAHLFDSTATLQQEVLGVLGVNLIYAAFRCCGNMIDLIDSLMDELSRDRIEIDMMKVSGPAFANVDHRLVSLQLVERGLTDAAMFTAAGEVVQPSEVLYKKPILVERGSFRPATKLTLDLLNKARTKYMQEPRVHGQEPIVLAEMTLRSLNEANDVDHQDFLARAEILGALGFDVLISRFEHYHQLADYLTGYTDGLIGLAVGLPAVRLIVQDRFYQELPGGLLESAGRLFKRAVRMYVYPTRDPETGEVQTVINGPIDPPYELLRDLLLKIGGLVPIDDFDASLLSIRTTDVLERLQRQDPSWESMVPPVVADAIKSKKLFGFVPKREVVAEPNDVLPSRLVN